MADEPPNKKLAIAEPSNKEIPMIDLTKELPIAEPSNNKITMIDLTKKLAKPSNKNEPKIFSFRMKPLRTLKHAISALADRAFNPSQKAMMEVGEDGVEITVDTNFGTLKKPIFGYLRLKASGLIDFKCAEPLTRTIALGQVSSVLKGPKNEEEEVFIYYVDGSKRLTIEFGTPAFGRPPGTPMLVNIHDISPAYKKFPKVCYGFEAIIPTQSFMPMITEMVKEKGGKEDSKKYNKKYIRRSAFVTVNIRTSVHIKAGQSEFTTPAKENSLYFGWPFWDSLKEASYLAEECVISLITEPEDNIMLRFDLKEVGDLVFMRGADLCFDKQLAGLGYYS